MKCKICEGSMIGELSRGVLTKEGEAYIAHKRCIALDGIRERGSKVDTKYKIGRNDPCYCGSGIKYKKCCLRRRTDIMDMKDNTFRKEVEAAKVPPEMEMRRNQDVYRLHLQIQKVMIEADSVHLQTAIAMVNAEMIDIKKMPDCECKEAILAGIDKQIEGLRKKIEDTSFAGATALTLDALERLDALLPLSTAGGDGAS